LAKGVIVAFMKFWPLVGVILLVAITVDLARALLTHDHVGPLEYTTGIALLVVLVLGAFRLSRRTIRRA
jgi:hypothetical protein